jgi:hypothetical protein
MMRRFSNKSLIIFISIIVAGAGIVWACADGGWDDGGNSSFTPESFVDTAYAPFFYSDQFYYGIGHDEAHVQRFNDDVVNEWQGYLGISKSDTELHYFLLQARKGIVDSVSQYFENASNPLPKEVTHFSMVQNRDSKKLKAFFTFLVYAKANEAYAAVVSYYWDYDTSKKQTLSDADKLIRIGLESQFSKTKDKFIKQRYWFQIIRSYFFGADYNTCIDWFEKYKDDFTQNVMYYRAMSYEAGAYYKQKKYSQANYLYSKVYDAGAAFKTVAHYSFHPQNESDWNATLQLCSNNQEKATLWQLLGIYFDEQRSIKEIYQLDPKSEKLELLLSRLINIEENRVSGYDRYGYDVSTHITSKDSAKLQTLQLVERIANAQNTSKPYMWQLAAGYLHFLYEDNAKASQYYTLAKTTLPQTNLLQAQYRLLLFINQLASFKTLDAAAESKLLPDLEWLQTLNTEKMGLHNFRYTTAYSWAKLNMSAKYKKQNEWLKAECFAHQDTFYTDKKQTANMKAFLQKANPSSFEQYCQNIYPVKTTDINEFQAIQLAFEDRINEAITLMKEGTGSATQLLGNPFNGRIRDCHDCDHEAAQKIKYTKLSFLEKLKEMQDKIAVNQDVYANNLLLANAFYNISYYGNARYFYECQVIGGEFLLYSFSPNMFDNMLVDNHLAMGYYKKALAAAQTDEQKAKCTFMIAKCTQNEMYNAAFKKNKDFDFGYAYLGPVDFSAMQNFKNTKYYQDVIDECGYFREYLHLKK